METSSNKFATRLKVLRKEFGLTQQDLSKKLGVVRTAIANYETNRSMPDPTTLNEISKIFNVSMDYLMGESDIRNHQNNKLPELTSKDKKDIAKDIDQIRQELLRQRNGEDSETLLFDGEPMTDDSIDKILAALEIGMEMVKRKIR